MSIAERIGSFLQRSAPVVEPTSGDRPFALWPPRTRRGLDPQRLDGFARAIEGFLRAHRAGPDHRRRGAVHFLSFEMLRQRFGKRWPGLREKALQIVETSLDRALGKDDLYVVVDETTVLLLVTGLTRGEAEIRLALIAADITERLCGTVPWGAALSLRTMPCDLEQVLIGVAGLRQLLERIEAAGRQADAEEMNRFQTTKPSLVTAFLPVLRVRKSMVSAYRTIVQHDDGGRRTPAGELLDGASVNGVFDAEIDRWCLERIAERLAQGRGRGHRAMVVVPVHYETLATRRFRDEYLAACRKLPPSSARRLIVEIVDLPSGLVQARSRDLLAYVRPFARAVGVRVAAADAPLDQLDGSGALLVSLAAPRVSAPDSVAANGARDPVAVLRGFVGRASALRLRTHVFGCATPGDCHAAVRAGVDMVDGEGLLPPVQNMDRVLRTAR